MQKRSLAKVLVGVFFFLTLQCVLADIHGAQSPSHASPPANISGEVSVPSAATAAPIQKKDARRIHLSTGKTLVFPVPGNSQPISSFPAALAITPDGAYAVTLNQGYGAEESGFCQSLSVLDLKTGGVTDFPEPRLSLHSHESYFLGLAFSTNGQRLYASIGSISDPTGARRPDTGNGIAVYSFHSGRIAPETFWKIPLRSLEPGKIAAKLDKSVAPSELIPFPAGLAVFQAPGGGERLLVADNLSDDALVLDAASGKILTTFDLSTQKIVPGSYPHSVAVTRDGRRAWLTLWNASRVAELDLSSGRITRMIPLRLPSTPIAPGSHPAGLLLSFDETRLFVALANTDEVADISIATGIVRAFYSTTLPHDAYRGAQPVALALDSRNHLYVADANANAVAVLDVVLSSRTQTARTQPRRLQPAGFIPTEWYPSALAVTGDDLLIATAKGAGTAPNLPWQTPPSTAGHRKKLPYILEMLHGSVSRVSLAMLDANLPELTRDVEGNGASPSGQSGSLPFAAGRNPIHHVIYIIRENRTYDQVLGDIAGANGDPSLTMYGEEITPNAHALARGFGILDNFYASGEVSGDGHNWSTAAIASDYLEATLPIAYRGDERLYDFEGEVANRIPLEDDMPDVNESGTGYIWTNVARHGLTYRHYGEFVNTKWCTKILETQSPTMGTPTEGGGVCARDEVRPGELLPAWLGEPPGSASPWPWPVPMIARNTATKPELRNHFDPRAADFRITYPDILRAQEFLNEFAGFVKARESGHGMELPNYVLLRLPNDHTAGTRPGAPAPSASIADNDLALGRVVDAVSHSPYWNDTAILVVEDDAQDGPDHVDAHRTVALVISKYSPSRGENPYVESSFFTTVNMVRTLEALLGLPPMNTNDGHAAVMGSLFSGDSGHPAFVADDRNLKNGLIYRTNSPDAYGAADSAQMDFSAADRTDTATLNNILWHDRMGDGPMPPPRHSIFPAGDGTADREAGEP